MDFAVVNRPETKVAVLVGNDLRVFVLRAQSARDILNQVRIQEDARKRAIAQMAEALEQTHHHDEGMPPSGLIDCYWQSVQPVVVELCREPADGGAPLTLQDCQQMPPAHYARVITAQEQLDQIEDALGNALALMQLGAQKRLSKLSAPGSSLEQPSPEQDSPPTP